MVAAGTAAGSHSAVHTTRPTLASCGSGYVDAHLGWGDKCLRAGEFCKVGNPDYHAYGFDCPASGHLAYYTAATSTTIATPSRATSTTPPHVERTVFLAKRTRTRGCTLSAEPDRRCSPGAYYSGLTKAVICSPTFRTSTIRHVTDGDRHAVEIEYGLAPKSYGNTLEIDHIVSLELGGSNDIANLYPEKATLPAHAPGYHVKDKLENKLHAMVCGGQISLRAAQRGIAADWEALYERVYGVAPN